MTALRYDNGKAPWHLLPFDALRAVARIMAFGVKKYAERNWELGMDHSRCFSSLMRHLDSYWQDGEDIDPESGELHLAHVSWNALVLLAYKLRGIGHDDRPREMPKDVNPKGEPEKVDAEPDAVEGVSCWHCGDVLEEADPPHCERCPRYSDGCDDGDCDAMACAEETARERLVAETDVGLERDSESDHHRPVHRNDQRTW